MTADREGSPPKPVHAGVPAPLVAAATLVTVEAVLLVLQGAAEMASISGERAVMGITTSVFFLIYGGGLAFCAWALSRLRSWARAPVVVAQLIQVFVAWSFRGGDTTAIAVGLGMVAILVLLAVFHPASIDALADDG
ncbi:MAG: hypothetical protein M3393_04200 [Actinomycetota bacterium]|nr:hypothetical protein [Actinomycetota bacterium]